MSPGSNSERATLHRTLKVLRSAYFAPRKGLFNFWPWAQSATRYHNLIFEEDAPMKRVAVSTVLFLLAVLIIAGCGTSSSKTSSTTGGGMLMVAMGDATSDRIIAFGLTVNTMTLTGGSNPTVVSTPTQIEFVRNAGTFQPLVQAHIAPGTYTGATFTLSNPMIVAVDPVSHLPVQLTAALSTSTVNVTFNTPLMISASTAVET